MENSRRLLLFGANGAIGARVASRFCASGWRVVGTTRGTIASRGQTEDGIEWLRVDPQDQPDSLDALCGAGPYHAVCWAQGVNGSDNVYSFDEMNHRAIYEANCVYILQTLNALLKYALLEESARLCIVSSIWQEVARQNKLSYMMTKAALRGLVMSASLDMGKDGYLINAILPGALDTPMTHTNLSDGEIQRLSDATKFGRLPSIGDVAELAYFLCSGANTSITGQFIQVDLGFSYARII